MVLFLTLTSITIGLMSVMGIIVSCPVWGSIPLIDAGFFLPISRTDDATLVVQSPFDWRIYPEAHRHFAIAMFLFQFVAQIWLQLPLFVLQGCATEINQVFQIPKIWKMEDILKRFGHITS